MGQVHIVTDSTCHIPEALRQELIIHVVQLPYVWDGVTYLDEVDMGPREFYSRLRADHTLLTTSAPTPGSFREILEPLAASGDPILLMHVGREFSSTHSTAELARGMLPDASIHLFDSHSNALGLGFQVLAVARAALHGADLSELLALCERARERTGVIFAVRDVEYIHRGGRINLGQMILASILDLVPIMQIKNGPLELIGRVRRSRNAPAKLVDLLEGQIQSRRPLRVGVLHADSEAEAFELRKRVVERLNPDELILQELSPILGVHTGPGAIGLAYSVGL